MTRVFVSYSRKDETFARRVGDSLSATGIDVWMDVDDIEVGSKWSKAIQQGLDSSDVLCVILSPASMDSPNVEDEFTYFLDQKKPVIPVYWKPCKVHFQLGRVQYIDFYTNSYDAGLKLLLAEIDKRKWDASALPPQPSSTIKTEKLTVEKRVSVAADQELGAVAKSASVQPNIPRTPAQINPQSSSSTRNGMLTIGAVIVLALVGVIGFLVLSNNNNNGSISGEITDQRVLDAPYQRGSSEVVGIKMPENWLVQQTGEHDLWITNDHWFYDQNEVLKPSVDAGRISMLTIGRAVNGGFTESDLRQVSLGAINGTFSEAGISRRFSEGDLKQTTINGYPAVWVGGQLENSDYYIAFYYLEDKQWLQGVVVNAGKGDLDRNQQLVDDLVRSIQVSV